MRDFAVVRLVAMEFSEIALMTDADRLEAPLVFAD